MNHRKIQMPREVYIGPDVIHETAEIFESLHLSKKALIITGHHTYDAGAKYVIENLEENDYEVDLKIIDDATYENVDEVEEHIDCDTLVVGVGGGKVIDVAKYASFNKDVYFVSMPTAASHDGIVSPLASIKNPNRSTSVKANAPIALIGDSNIIADSPFRLLSAGCADLISNFTAVKDWQLAHRLKFVEYSESAASLSIMSAKLITNNIENIKPGLEESARIVMKSLFSSGTAISIAGSSRPAMMALYGADWKFIRDCLKAVGAPINAKQLGISDDDVIEALVMANEIRPDRYTILGDNGISKDAAYELAHNTEVI